MLTYSEMSTLLSVFPVNLVVIFDTGSVGLWGNVYWMDAHKYGFDKLDLEWLDLFFVCLFDQPVLKE